MAGIYSERDRDALRNEKARVEAMLCALLTQLTDDYDVNTWSKIMTNAQLKGKTDSIHDWWVEHQKKDSKRLMIDLRHKYSPQELEIIRTLLNEDSE